VLHIAIPNISTLWLNILSNFWRDLGQSLQWTNTPEQQQRVLQFMSQFATGIAAAALLGCDLFLLVLARGWQAMIFNPKGLAKELCQIRMGLVLSVMLLVCIAAAWLGSALAMDALPLLLLPFMIAGLSVIHAKVAHKKEFKLPVLIGLYMALLFAMPYVAMLLAFLGLVDAWFDFRALQETKKEAAST
jgi:Sec-independent protein secretion pathway component TatC